LDCNRRLGKKKICARFVPHVLTTVHAPSYNAATLKKFLVNRNVSVLHHPPYPSDLTPADYFLLPKLKFSLKGRLFQTVEEIQCAVKRELKTFQKPLSWRGTCKQIYWSRRNVFWWIKINHVHIRRYLRFITVVYKLLGRTLYYVELIVNSIKLSGCLHNFFCFFPPPLAPFSINVIEFCFCEEVQLICQVITHHVTCAELLGLWLCADRNCEPCQNSSHMKEGIWCTFRTIANFRNNSNSKYNRAFSVVAYFIFK
jgi:hypothetical protein